MSQKQPQNQSLQQQGGVINSINLFMMNMDSPATLIYGALLIILIVYSSVIPGEYRTFADSLLGRVLGVAVVYGVVETLGWVYGLLTAIAFLLIINGASRIDTTMLEAFDGGGTVSEKKTIGKKWFVERVLGENPTKIATDRVTTTAVET
jgi:hypothetical protein